MLPLAVSPCAAQELPGGNSAEFRDRAPTQPASPQTEEGEPVRDLPARPAQATAQLPRLSSGFGYRRHPILGRTALHAGIDIPAPLGTPVLAANGGVVDFAGYAGSYGQMVEIDHGNGLKTRYAHLSRLLVQPGMAVTRQERIALMGSTGRSTGSHLHFEVRVNGRPANPLAYFGNQEAGPQTVQAPVYEPPAPSISQYAMARAGRGQQQGEGF